MCIECVPPSPRLANIWKRSLPSSPHTIFIGSFNSNFRCRLFPFLISSKNLVWPNSIASNLYQEFCVIPGLLLHVAQWWMVASEMMRERWAIRGRSGVDVEEVQKRTVKDRVENINDQIIWISIQLYAGCNIHPSFSFFIFVTFIAKPCLHSSVSLPAPFRSIHSLSW